MRSIITVLFCLFLSACTSVPYSAQTVADSAPRLLADGIEYLGIHHPEKHINAFLGVPFAQPPVGDLRWSPPRQLAAGRGVENAQNYAPACMQGPHLVNWYKGVISSFGGNAELFPRPQVSEDCLYLNIWSPSVSESLDLTKPLPVYVFLHGGSNKGGWSYEPNYIGDKMADRGMIVITVAYRLGAFGFFAHPELSQANFALLDQIAALKWIQRNIASIGGDPQAITVAGESAGAGNIAYLLASPLASGLFQRVIHQSAGWPMYGADSKTDVDALGLRLQEHVLGTSVAKGIDAMREVPAAVIQQASEDVYQDYFFDSVIDGHSVLQSVSDAAGKGRLEPVDLIVGSNANEALMYIDKSTTAEQWIEANLPDADAQQILAALPADSSPLQKLDRLVTAHSYTCPSLRLAEAMNDSGGRAWVYHFTRIRPGKLAAEMGAYHGAELPYVFDTHDDWLPTDQLDRQLTGRMANYWRQFIFSGDPNSPAMPVWHPYTRSSSQAMILGDTVRSAEHASRELCTALGQ